MMTKWKILPVIACSAWVLMAAWAGSAAAGPEKMGGWELDGAYNQLYKSSERDRLKGVIEEVTEVIPLPGMSPGVAIILRDEDGDKVRVHLGPRWFVDPQGIGVRKGDEVKIRGAWAEVGGEDVFIASKVKRSEFEEFKVRRTRDGYPFWCMSPEELAAEKSGE